MVRDLQRALVEAQGGGSGTFGGTPVMTLPQFGSDDERPTYVLVVDANCLACRDRADDYARLSGSGLTGHLVALTKDPACAGWFTGSAVHVVLDPVLLGTVGVGVTPMLLEYGPDGTERWRRVVGSRLDLHRLVDAAEETASTPSAAAEDVTGRA
jgi:hypothetical protein